MKTPYMCLACGNVFATSQEAKDCNHEKKKPARRKPAAKVVNEKDL